MGERNHHITDDGSLHKYRTEIPNTIIRGMRGRGVSLPARWLYVYLKSVAGDNGECWQNMTTLAAGAQLSRGAVSKARKELIAAKLIAVTKGKGALHETDRIRILDIWHQNMTEFCDIPSSSGERGPSSLGEHEEDNESVNTASKDDSRVHQVNAPSSSGERGPSSLGELKKIPKKISKNKDSAPGDFSEGAQGQAPENKPVVYSKWFTEFWAAYPIKKNKDKAWEAWQKKKCEPDGSIIVASIGMHQRHDNQWHRGYIPYPATFLNAGGWKDELADASTSTANNGLWM